MLQFSIEDAHACLDLVKAKIKNGPMFGHQVPTEERFFEEEKKGGGVLWLMGVC